MSESEESMNRSLALGKSFPTVDAVTGMKWLDVGTGPLDGNSLFIVDFLPETNRILVRIEIGRAHV